MRLRKHLFALLDRNLLLGDATGVKMHDVVREFARISVQQELQGNQLRFVRVLQSQLPEGGWTMGEASPTAMQNYAMSALRHHMTEALANSEPDSMLDLLEPSFDSITQCVWFTYVMMKEPWPSGIGI